MNGSRRGRRHFVTPPAPHHEGPHPEEPRSGVSKGGWASSSRARRARSAPGEEGVRFLSALHRLAEVVEIDAGILRGKKREEEIAHGLRQQAVVALGAKMGAAAAASRAPAGGATAHPPQAEKIVRPAQDLRQRAGATLPHRSRRSRLSRSSTRSSGLTLALSLSSPGLTGRSSNRRRPGVLDARLRGHDSGHAPSLPRCDRSIRSLLFLPPERTSR